MIDADKHIRIPAGRGSQLRQVGATEACIVCSMPALPGVTAFVHMQMRDLVSSPPGKPTRIFCLCWHHHHGCYDQCYISTFELLRAKNAWIDNKQRRSLAPRQLKIRAAVAFHPDATVVV